MRQKHTILDVKTVRVKHSSVTAISVATSIVHIALLLSVLIVIYQIVNVQKPRAIWDSGREFLRKHKIMETNISSSTTDSLLLRLLNEVNDLRNEVRNLYMMRISGSLQMPIDIVEDDVNRLIKKRLCRPLLESEIVDAIGKHKTMVESAKYLGVGYETLKKYARMYGVWKVRPQMLKYDGVSPKGYKRM